MTNVVDLWPRRRAAARSVTRDRRPPPGHIEVATYTRAAVHEGVPLTLMLGALIQAGLTVTNLPGHGLVVHRIGQNPYASASPLIVEPQGT